MTMRIALEFLHFVIGALVVLPMAVLPFAGIGEARANRARGLRGLGRATRFFSVLAIAVGVLGLALVSYVPGLTIVTPWLGGSVLLYAAAIALSLGVIAPGLTRAGESLTVERPAPLRAITVSAVSVSVFLIAVVVLMVWKP